MNQKGQLGFLENIEIDLEHKHRLLSVDSVSHQFMYKGIFKYEDIENVYDNIYFYIDSRKEVVVI